MTPQEKATITREVLEAWNERDCDRAAALMAENLEWMNAPTGEISHGPQGYLQFLKAWYDAFPDATNEIVNEIAAGEWVIAEGIGRGTQTGLLKGPAGQIAPTGRKIEVRFCLVVHVHDGKIDRGRLYIDTGTMMQ